MSIANNVKLPLLYAGALGKEHSERFGQVADSLGIGSIFGKNRLNIPVGKSKSSLRMGRHSEFQAALADEPAAALDSANRSRIIALLFGLNQDSGSTIVTVMHDASLADQHDRIIKLQRKA